MVDGNGKKKEGLTKHGVYKRIASILPKGTLIISSPLYIPTCFICGPKTKQYYFDLIYSQNFGQLVLFKVELNFGKCSLCIHLYVLRF